MYEVGSLHQYLPNAGEMEANDLGNLAIAHAVGAQGKNIGTELGFIRITQIAFG